MNLLKRYTPISTPNPPQLTNMRHHLLRLTMAPSSSSPSRTTTNRKPSSNPNFPSNPNNSNSYPNCSHSPSATLDILILILVLFSGAFLISSYFSYIFHSLSLILPPLSISSVIADSSAAVYLFGFSIFFVVSVIGFEICCGNRSRKCGKKGCKGLKNAMEFDLQLQTEEILRSGRKWVKEMEELPWKGGSETNPDYECLRSELRKMAPPNGRGVLLFRMKCGCPVAKLEGWGPKPRRRNKKSNLLGVLGYTLRVSPYSPPLPLKHNDEDATLAEGGMAR